MMDRLQVRSVLLSSAKAKALEDAKKMQAQVEEDCKKQGKEVPAYLLQELIGKGSFGRVYKAADLKTNGLVAVKMIDIEESDTLNPKLADSYSEFLKEINALKLLSESGAKNINHILDVLPVGQSMWMVTEHCAGGSVATLMKPTAPRGLQEQWIIPILREVAEAIYWVHKEGIIHRDIKCANVLVTETGAVQLCDFGVAGVVENKYDKRSTFIGTPHWMAPELFDPNPSYGTPVDIWAFGSMVYEIASGLPPNVMQGIGLSQLGQYLRSHTPRLEGDQYSEQLKDLVAFCFVEDPAKRPAIEEIQKHAYIYNTSTTHPTSSLTNLVKGYKVWEAQGGARKSLFDPHGAQGLSESDFASTALANDEWNFSTTLEFDRQVIDADTQAVYDVYGSKIDLDFENASSDEPSSRTARAKPRRRLPPQLPVMKAPLEKIFDPNTISNYDDNSRAYYGLQVPTPVSDGHATDLPLRDDSMYSSLRESLIDLDASFNGDDLSRFVDMGTIRIGPHGSTDYRVVEDGADHDQPPPSDPVDANPNRRTQDWKFPSMAPSASANPDMAPSPSEEGRVAYSRPSGTSGASGASRASGRPPLMHHATDPSALQSATYEQLPPSVHDNRISVGSLIDLDESLAMPELTRPSTANSDAASVSGSDMGVTNPFELERHASLYQPMRSSIREPSIYVSDDSDFARLAKAPDEVGMHDFANFHSSNGINGVDGVDGVNGSSGSNGVHGLHGLHGVNGANGVNGNHSRQSSYDGGGYSGSEYLDSEYSTMSRRQSRSRSSTQQSSLASNGPGMPTSSEPPSITVMQGLAGREELREDVMRLLTTFSEHLRISNTHISSLPHRRTARHGTEMESQP